MLSEHSQLGVDKLILCSITWSSQTFKACMGVGSWSKTPLWPEFDIIREMVQKRATEGDLTIDKD